MHGIPGRAGVDRAAAANAAGSVCTCAMAGGVAENTADNADPSIKPAEMPNLKLKDDEIEALAAFINKLASKQAR